MNSQERLVAFIDILGFSQMIEAYDAGEKNLLDALKEALEKALQLFQKNNQLSEHQVIKSWRQHLDYRSFSDCICVSIPIRNTGFSPIENIRLFLQFIGAFQLVMFKLGNGYLIRGGVSAGEFYFDDNMIFSKALVDAYQLESKKAVVPRILIGEKLLRLIDAEAKGNDQILTAYPILAKFEDTYSFVNFLNYDLKSFELNNHFIDRANKQLVDQPAIDGFEEAALAEKRDAIANILYMIDERLKANDYPQEVINKYHWLKRFLHNEIKILRTSPLAF